MSRLYYYLLLNLLRISYILSLNGFLFSCNIIMYYLLLLVPLIILLYFLLASFTVVASHLPHSLLTTFLCLSVQSSEQGERVKNGEGYEVRLWRVTSITWRDISFDPQSHLISVPFVFWILTERTVWWVNVRSGERKERVVSLSTFHSLSTSLVYHSFPTLRALRSSLTLVTPFACRLRNEWGVKGRHECRRRKGEGWGQGASYSHFPCPSLLILPFGSERSDEGSEWRRKQMTEEPRDDPRIRRWDGEMIASTPCVTLTSSLSTGRYQSHLLTRLTPVPVASPYSRSSWTWPTAWRWWIRRGTTWDREGADMAAVRLGKVLR